MAQIKKQDTYTTTNKVTEIYSDFYPNLSPHPVTEDLVRLTNESSVKRSIRSLIMTNRGERLFQPDIGSRINQLLFEQMDSFTADTLQQEIYDTIIKHEPRARIDSVSVIPNYDYNAYTVNVIFSVINREQPLQLNISLSRVR